MPSAVSEIDRNVDRLVEAAVSFTASSVLGPWGALVVPAARFAADIASKVVLADNDPSLQVVRDVAVDLSTSTVPSVVPEGRILSSPWQQDQSQILLAA